MNELSSGHEGMSLNEDRYSAIEALSRLRGWGANSDDWMDANSYKVEKNQAARGAENKFRNVWFTSVILHAKNYAQTLESSDPRRSAILEKAHALFEKRKEEAQAGEEIFYQEVARKLGETELCTTYGRCEPDKLRAMARLLEKDPTGQFGASHTDMVMPELLKHFPVTAVQEKRISTGTVLTKEIRQGLVDLLARLYDELGIDQLKRAHLGNSAALVEMGDDLIDMILEENRVV